MSSGEKSDWVKFPVKSEQFDEGAEYRGWVWNVLKEKLLALKVDPAKASVVDLACGTGRSTRGMVLDGIGKEGVIGVDPDASHLKTAKEHNDGIKYIEATAATLDLPDGSLDAVVIYSGFNFFGNDEASFKNIRRMLKPNGICMVVTETIGSFTKEGRAIIAKYGAAHSDESPMRAPVGESSAKILTEEHHFSRVETETHKVTSSYSADEAYRKFENARGRDAQSPEDKARLDQELHALSEKYAQDDLERGGKGVVSQESEMIVDIAYR